MSGFAAGGRGRNRSPRGRWPRGAPRGTERSPQLGVSSAEMTPRLPDPHRVVIRFDLDGDELGDRTHGQVAAQLKGMVLSALAEHGYRLGGVVGLEVTVDDA